MAIVDSYLALDGTRVPVFDNGQELVPWTCGRCGLFYNPEMIKHDHAELHEVFRVREADVGEQDERFKSDLPTVPQGSEHV